MRDVPARAFRAIRCDCDAGPIPLPDGSASVVFAKEVMEHLDDPAGFLADLARIGRPGARYYLSVPDPVSESLLRVVAPESYWTKPGHIHVFPRDELDRMIEDAGLEIERRKYFGAYWSLWWCLRMAIGADQPPGRPGDAPGPALADWA